MVNLLHIKQRISTCHQGIVAYFYFVSQTRCVKHLKDETNDTKI